MAFGDSLSLASAMQTLHGRLAWKQPDFTKSAERNPPVLLHLYFRLSFAVPPVFLPVLLNLVIENFAMHLF